MNFIERKEKLEYLLEMIEKGRCVSLGQIAKQFDCSNRTIKRMIYILRNDGNNIKYCFVNRRFILKK